MPYTDILIKGVKVSLDRERTLLFDFNAFIALEDIYGDTSKVFGLFQNTKDLKMKTVRNLLWAGLLHEDETLTIRQAGSFLNFKNMPEVSEKVAQALKECLPETVKEKPKVGE